MLSILFFSLIEKFQKKTLGKIKIQQTQRKKKKDYQIAEMKG